MPLEALSRRSEDIHGAVREKITKNADSYAPGLLEQYKIMLRRLDEGAPGCELISFPGFLSFPNPPKPNKKYITMLFALNHNFSRGTIVSNSMESDAYTINQTALALYFEIGRDGSSV
jgi:hypothetical protein